MGVVFNGPNVAQWIGEDRKASLARKFSLSSIISSSRAPTCFKFYITFVNSDGCKIHVPVHPSNSGRFKAIPEELVIAELQRKAKKYFTDLAPEYQPLLLPESEFFLKVRTARQPLPILRGARGIRDAKRTKDVKARSRALLPLPSPPKIKVELPTKPVDLHNLESFTKAFVDKRFELNLSQAEVARSLRVLYNFQRSGSLVSRVERMDLTLNNLLLVYPVFLRWLKDTEADETREAILRSAKGEVVDETVVKQMSEKLQNCDSNLFRKHRDRTKLLPGSTKVLEKAFKTSTHPPKKVIEDLAKKLEVDKHVIRVWFYNRRQRPKSSTA